MKTIRTACYLYVILQVIVLRYSHYHAIELRLLLKSQSRHCLPKRIVTVTVGANRALVESGGLPTQVPQTVVAVVGCEPPFGYETSIFHLL